MKKLFNVVADLDNMTRTQMMGAIRNMEGLSNQLNAAFESVINSAYGDEHYDNVLTLSFESLPSWLNELYLPSIDGKVVIINKSRPDSLLRWKLQFFAKYGNLKLEFITSGDGSAQMQPDSVNQGIPGYTQWQLDKLERSRSDAALYESMRNTKL